MFGTQTSMTMIKPSSGKVSLEELLNSKLKKIVTRSRRWKLTLMEMMVSQRTISLQPRKPDKKPKLCAKKKRRNKFKLKLKRSKEAAETSEMKTTNSLKLI